MIELEVPLVGERFKVIFCSGDNYYLKKVMKSWKYTEVLKSIDLDKETFNRAGLTIFNPQCHPIIWMPILPITPYGIGTLCHEAVHACKHILVDKMGERCDTEEILEHLVGELIEAILTGIRKNRKKIVIHKPSL